MTLPSGAATAGRILLIHPSPSVVLEGLAERFTPDLRLVVPNVQAGRDLRGHLRNAGQAITLTQLAREGLRAEGWTALTAGTRDAFLRDALADIPFTYLEPLRQRPSTLLSLQRLLGEFMRSNVDPAALLEVSAPGRELDVALAYAAVVSRSLAQRRYDTVGTEFFAAQLRTLPAQPLLVYGFAYFDAAQVSLLGRLLATRSLVTLPFAEGAHGLKRTRESLDALTLQGFEVRTLTGPARTTGDEIVSSYLRGEVPPPTFQKAEFADIEAEVRACLRQVRAWMAEGCRPERLAVIVRSEGAYIGALADVGREYNLPLVSGQQVPLLTTPLGGLVQAWVDAHALGWRYSAARRVLTHPLLSPALDMLARGRALQPACPAGPAAWSEDLTWLELPEFTTWRVGLGILQRLLVELGVLGRCAALPALNVAVTLLTDRLDAEARRDDACDREELLNLVAHVLKTTTVPVLLGRSGVRVASPLAALGRQFDHVWILGLSDTLFPARTAEHPLIDSAARAVWGQRGVRVPDAASLSSVEEALFVGAVAAAGLDLVISRPRRGPDGRELRPSVFWNRLGEGAAPVKALPLGSEGERQLARALEGHLSPALAGKAQIERSRDLRMPGPHAGQLSTPILVGERRWSPSQLHAAGACRYRWFAQKLLQLDEPVDPDLLEDRRVTGTLLHAALEGALKGEAPGDTAADRTERAETALQLKERQLRASGELRPGPLWPVQLEEIRRAAQRSIRSAAFLPAGWRPTQLEQRVEFTVEAGEHTYNLVGVVDRVDETPEGRTVTDYKKGRYVSKVVLNGVLNLEVQLPLYMQALQAVNGRYLSIEKAENLPEAAGPGAQSPRKKYRWAEHQESVTAFLEELGSALASGDVSISADRKREACQYCPVQPVCRDRGLEVPA